LRGKGNGNGNGNGNGKVKGKAIYKHRDDFSINTTNTKLEISTNKINKSKITEKIHWPGRPFEASVTSMNKKSRSLP
jgi:hypothetical protein